MKRLLPLVILFLISTAVSAQGVDKGRFLIDLGAGVGGYQATQNFDDGSNTEAGTNLTNFYLRFDAGIKKGFALGLTFKSYGSITNNSTDSLGRTTSTEFSMGSVLLNSSFHLINRPKFGVFVGTGLGGSSLSILSEKTDSLSTVTTSTDATAVTIAIQAGLHKYFGKRIGFHVVASYVSMPFGIIRHERDGVGSEVIGSQKLEAATLNLRGIEVTAGLSFRLGK